MAACWSWQLKRFPCPCPRSICSAPYAYTMGSETRWYVLRMPYASTGLSKLITHSSHCDSHSIGTAVIWQKQWPSWLPFFTVSNLFLQQIRHWNLASCSVKVKTSRAENWASWWRLSIFEKCKKPECSKERHSAYSKNAKNQDVAKKDAAHRLSFFALVFCAFQICLKTSCQPNCQLIKFATQKMPGQPAKLLLKRAALRLLSLVLVLPRAVWS